MSMVVVTVVVTVVAAVVTVKANGRGRFRLFNAVTVQVNEGVVVRRKFLDDAARKAVAVARKAVVNDAVPKFVTDAARKVAARKSAVRESAVRESAIRESEITKTVMVAPMIVVTPVVMITVSSFVAASSAFFMVLCPVQGD
jgi:hypothetical protein